MAKLKTECQEPSQQLEILPLHSTINDDEQRRVFDSVLTKRKVIISTNIAESSITVPDIEYVIDFCLTKNLVMDEKSNYPTLRLEWASEANLIQRAGRAGRTREGRVYRMIYNSFVFLLNKYPDPEIRRTPLELSVLRVKKLRMDSPKEMLALCIDPPNLEDIRKSVMKLKRVGGLSVMHNGTYEDEDGDLTHIGKIMATLPIDVSLSKLVLVGYTVGLAPECLKIAACLSIRSMFSKPFDLELDAFKSKLAWADDTFSDMFAYLKAFEYYEQFKSVTHNEKSLKSWCRMNYIQKKRIDEVGALYDELRKRITDAGLCVDPPPNIIIEAGEREMILKIAFCAAFFPNYFTQNPVDKDAISKMMPTQDILSSVEISGLPQNQGVLYADQIRNLFVPCSDQVDIDFEETKAVVTFSGTENPLKDAWEKHHQLSHGFDAHSPTETAVKRSVYIAVKMRLIHHPLNITILRKEAAETLIEQIKEGRDNKLNGKRTLRSNRYVINSQKSVLPLLKLPNYKTNIFYPNITNIEKCGHFWCQEKTGQTAETIRKIRSALEIQRKEPVGRDVRIGDLVFVVDTHPRDEYCRGRVDAFRSASDYSPPEARKMFEGAPLADQRECKIFLVDYGKTIWVPKSMVYVLDTGVSPVLTEAGLAFECKLIKIKPAVYRNNSLSHDTWSQEATDKFTEMVIDCEGTREGVECQVFSVVERVVRVQLVVRFPENRAMDVAEELMKAHYAETADEIPASLLNRDMRINLNNLSSSLVPIAPGFPGEREATEDTAQDDDDETGVLYSSDSYDVTHMTPSFKFPPRSQTQRLKGPCSPLEVSFHGITKQNATVRIGVGRDSVNSVTLESDPMNHLQRLMVAGSVSLSAETEKVITRDTTVMPFIPGFPSLMCLLFSPTVELRVDNPLPEKSNTIHWGHLWPGL